MEGNWILKGIRNDLLHTLLKYLWMSVYTYEHYKTHTKTHIRSTMRGISHILHSHMDMDTYSFGLDWLAFDSLEIILSGNSIKCWLCSPTHLGQTDCIRPISNSHSLLIEYVQPASKNSTKPSRVFCTHLPLHLLTSPVTNNTQINTYIGSVCCVPPWMMRGLLLHC